MKAAERLPFLELANEVGWGLCAFCPYCHTFGSECSGGTESECDHPINRVADLVFPDALFGADCWAFRPMVSVSDVADVVGIILSEGFDPTLTLWYDDGEGQAMEVAGFKRRLQAPSGRAPGREKAMRQNTLQRGTIDVSEPTQIPCLICHGTCWELLDWHYQPPGNEKGLSVVRPCGACHGTGKMQAVTMVSPEHEHKFEMVEKPCVDNNWQGLYRCNSCPTTILGH